MLSFSRVVQRAFWVVPLVAVGAAGTLHARGTAELVGIGLGVDKKGLATLPPLPEPATSGVSTRNRTAGPLVSHNPFDSANVVLRGDASGDVAEAPASERADPMAAPACDGVKALAILSSPDPEWSVALLSASPEKKAVLRRKGGDVAGRQVTFVGPDRVWLMSGNTLCQVGILQPRVVGVSPSASPPAFSPPSSPAGAPSLPPEIARGIVRVGPSEFNVDRAVVDQILANQAELMKQVRLVPEQESGRVVGVRLSGVRGDSVLGALGIENGDRLDRINGLEMTSPEKALEVYARIRFAERLVIAVNRRGKPLNVDLNIH